MSKTIKRERELNNEWRPEWQQERGPRYGNLRKQNARLKVQERRRERAMEKDKFVQGEW